MCLVESAGNELNSKLERVFLDQASVDRLQALDSFGESRTTPRRARACSRSAIGQGASEFSPCAGNPRPLESRGALAIRRGGHPAKLRLRVTQG
jgi:hypothetical protein